MTESTQPNTTPAEPRHNPRKPLLFLCGAIAPLVIYSVYYFFNLDALQSQIEKFSGGGSLLVVMIVLVVVGVSAFCGFWALICDSRSPKAAFTTGLGFPGMVMGLSGFAAAPSGPLPPGPPEATQDASLVPYVTTVAAAESNAFVRALKIVFNPVGTVVEARTDEVAEAKAQEITDLAEEKDALAKQTVELRQSMNSLQVERQQALAQAATLQVQVQSIDEQANARLEAAQATIEEQNARLEDLDQELRRATGEIRQLERLRVQLREKDEVISELQQESDRLRQLIQVPRPSDIRIQP